MFRFPRLYLLFAALVVTFPARAALIDQWLASDLNFPDGTHIADWTSRSNRVAAASFGDEPLLKQRATPTGLSALQFDHNRLIVLSSPVAGLGSFSVAIVFRVDEPGADDGSGWSTKSGIVDANQSGAANDWGFAVRDTGFICFGTGSVGGSDRTVYLDDQPTYPSVVDSKYHVAVCTWGGGVQVLYLDDLPGKVQGGVSTNPRGDPGLCFGGLNTGEANRQFVGELAAVQFFSTALSSTEVADTIKQLTAVYLAAQPPAILSFTASTNFVVSGSPVTLSWSVSNAALVTIDNEVGSFTSPTGAVQVAPSATTIYTLTANNSVGSVASQVRINVPEPPVAPHGVFLSTDEIPADAVPGSFIAAFRAVDQNRYDAHQFSFVAGPGDDHNALFVLVTNRLVAGPGFPVSTSTNLSVRVRATDPTGLFFERSFSLHAAKPASVVINEIHYNPLENTIREEFVELFNPTRAAVDMSGWRLRGGVSFDFPTNIILPAGGYLVVASDPTTILSRYSAQALGPWQGNLSSDGERVTLRDAVDQKINEVEYKSEFPWPVGSNGGGGSMELLNPSLDNDLGSSWSTSLDPAVPSPGAANRVFVTNAAPNIRQVNHTPKQPVSTNTVTITAKVTDREGVAAVVLQYQVVAPGDFIPAYVPLSVTQLNANPFAVPPANPAFESPASWTSVPMHDDGLNGDAVVGDDIYTVVLPPRSNRTLVRYRIVCQDDLGASRRAPFNDDPSLNFAYFVYDGVPDYRGVASTNLTALPVYFLITRAPDFNACTAYSGGDQLPQFSGDLANEARFVFNWPGAFVYDGEVYDHVRYRLRGANGRYQQGKRSFRIKFNQGRYLDAKDEFGRRYPRKWSTLNTAKGQSNRLTLTYSLNEYLNYILLNKVGVPSPFSHYFHWRVVRTPQEAPDNYNGDFYGISWAQEDYDVDFLEAHNLPKGNLYKLINAQRAYDPYGDMVQQQRYQAPFAPTGGADAVRIQNILLNPTASQTDAWLLANVNYTNWFAYDAILEAVRNYDTWPSANKNAAWYFDTDYNSTNEYNGRFWTLPWDWTDTWGPTWNDGQDLAWNGVFGPTASLHPEMRKEFRNTVREIRELLFQRDQIEPLIDAVAARLAPVAPADLLRWANATPYGSSYSSLGTAGPGLTQGLAGYAQDLKDFMFNGGSHPWWIDRQNIATGGWIKRLDTLAQDAEIPAQPVLEYVGTPGFPLSALVFQSSGFSDPQSAMSFAAMQWRVGEVLDTNQPPSDPRVIPPMEWDPIWDSGKLQAWQGRITVPGSYLQAGKLYRARVRHMDNTGRWSKWSAPVQFSPAADDIANELRRSLHFSEMMYNPPAFAGFDGDELEFLELANSSTNLIDLSGFSFDGITYTFPAGSTLLAGHKLLLGRNAAALQQKYPGVHVDGIYTGKLDNAGETIRLKTPAGEAVVEVSYQDVAPWPATADGSGYSLVLADAETLSYCASAALGGSPGADDCNEAWKDQDGDRLPDAWELANGSDLLNPNGAEDPDNDGLSNYAEFLCGTDPRDPASTLKFDDCVSSPGQVALSFTALPNRSYAILSANDLAASTWQTETNVSASAGSRSVRFEQAVNGTRFYRLTLVPAP